MRLSKVIKGLQTILEIHGDVLVKNWKIEDETGGMSSFMYSPTRKDKDGNRMKMNGQEFKAFVAKIKKQNA